MFHFNQKEDYAIYMVCLLASHPKTMFSSKNIAENLKASEAIIKQTAGKLKHAGLIRSKEGIGGGYQIAIKPKNISLLMVISAISSNDAEVFENLKCQSCHVANVCKTTNVWQKLSQQLYGSLNKINIQQVISNEVNLG